MPECNIEPKAARINRQVPSLAEYLSERKRRGLELAPLPDEQGQQLAVCLTVLESHRLLTKSFQIGATGKIEKTGHGAFWSGTAARTLITGKDAGEALRQLARLLSGLSSHQAIVTTAPPAGSDRYAVVATAELSEHPGAIARSRKFFRAAPGPGLLAIDFDTRGYPPELRSRIEAAGDLSAVLCGVFCGFRDAASLRRNSASSGIQNTAAGGQTSDSGQHRYYVVADGLDAAGFVERLHKRLILAGYGFGIVRESGVVDICSPVDVSASAPERIVYEANAELGEGLAHVAKAREPVVTDGGFLDTRALPDLSASEEEAHLAECNAIRVALRDEAAAQRAIWIEKRVAERAAKGEPEQRVRRSLTGAAERQELSGDAIEIILDDGTSVTPNEIQANLAAYHEKTCADPLEPEYGGGRNIAIIYTKGHSRPIIHSQAHGGVRYVLMPDPDVYFDALGEESAKAGDEPSPFAEQPKAQRTLELLSLADILAQGLDSQTPPLIEGVLKQGELSVLYGESGIGKSFVALSMAFSVASGSRWAGKEVASMPVVYVAAEGGNGVKKRLIALVDETGREDAPFHLYPGNIDMSRPDAELEPLIATVNQIAGVGLIVIDTLSRALSGGDESSPVDMGKFVKHADRLRHATGAHVLVVHHSGKDAARGARGHSLLRGALDTEMEVTRGLFRVTKQKDDDDEFNCAFRLKPVVLGLDSRNRVVTSCVAIVEHLAVSARQDQASAVATRAEHEILTALGRLHETSPQARGFSAQGVCDSGLLKRSNVETVRSHLRHLEGKDQVEKISRGTWALRAIRDGFDPQNGRTGSVSANASAEATDILSGEHSVHGCYSDIFQ